GGTQPDGYQIRQERGTVLISARGSIAGELVGYFDRGGAPRRFDPTDGSPTYFTETMWAFSSHDSSTPAYMFFAKIPPGEANNGWMIDSSEIGVRITLSYDNSRELFELMLRSGAPRSGPLDSPHLRLQGKKVTCSRLTFAPRPP